MEKYFKQLLLKDLCSRLPYNLYCKVEGVEEPVKVFQIEVSNIDGILLNFDFKIDNLSLQVYLSEVKPYLRPMSSMTQKEKQELKDLLGPELVSCSDFGYLESGTFVEYISSIPYSLCIYVIDWLNAHYFDYRGLIEKGLAIDCTNLNIY